MISPALLAQLSQRGIIPPQQPAAPTSTVPPDILAYAQGLQQGAQPAPPAPPPQPAAAVPPKPLASYSAADINAANGGAPPQATISPEAWGLSTHRKPYNVVQGSAEDVPTRTPAPAAQAEAAPAPAAASQQGAAGVPLQMIPGREIRMVSPTAQNMMEKAFGERDQAANASEAAELGANEANAKELDALAETNRKQREAMEQREAGRGKAYNDQLADYRRYADEAARGEVKAPHPGILGAIGVALGAMGSSLTHTPNSALEILNKRIDDNIAAQRANIENKRGAARQSLEGLGEMRARFGDERQAEAAERAREIEQTKAAGDAMVARAQSPMLSAKWQTVRAGLDEEQAKWHIQAFPYQPAHMVGGVGTKPLENVFMAPDGQRYQARDAESRKRLAEAATTMQDVHGQLSDYAHALSQVTAADRLAFKAGITTSAMSRAQTTYNHALSTARQAQHDGVWKKSEVEMLANTLTPPEAFTGDPQVQMQAANKAATDAFNHVMTVEDALPVQQGFAVTPQGQLAPRNAYTGGTVAPPAPGASTIGRPVR